MKHKLMFLIIMFLLCGCVSTKPFFFAADKQEKEVNVVMGVFYDDFEEKEVMETFTVATKEFYKRTNINVTIKWFKHVDWESRDMYKMSNQVCNMYPDGVVPASWVFMIYKKTPLEWFLILFVGNVEGAAEAGGHWAFANRLSSDLIIHELYHLGWKINEKQ